MRDTWFAFNAHRGSRDSQYGRSGEDGHVVWSWDYDGASDVLRTRRPSPKQVPRGQLWPAIEPTWSLDPERPNAYRVDDFWRTLLHVSGPTVPSLVMSGSARVVYQTPGMFEQDGLSHVDMQNEGLRLRGYGPHVHIDPHALHLPYDLRSVRAHGFDETSRAKMDIVLRQIRYTQRVLKVKKLLFVFVDDIFASVLRDMFSAFPRLLPRGVTVHLVHFESYRDRHTPLSQTYEVIPGVLFSPY